jgi:hypothetical protein
LIVTLKAKQLQLVLAFKEQEEKSQLMSDIAKYNPTIVVGSESFIPLNERPHIGGEEKDKEKKESNANPMKLQRASMSDVTEPKRTTSSQTAQS